MKRLILIFALASLFIFSLIFMPKLVFQQIKTEESTDSYFAPGKIVIRFTKEVSPIAPLKVAGIIQTGIGPVDESCLRFRVHTMRRLFPAPKYPTPDLTRYFVVEFDESMDLDDMVKTFSEIHFYIEKAEKVGVHKFSGDPNDRSFNDQWHLKQSNDCDIDAPEGWDIQAGSDSVILAIPDSGVQYTHPDLNDNIWINWYEYYGVPGQDDDPNGGNGYVDDIYGWNWDSDDPKDPMDYHGHGTHVAGIAAAETNNDRGVAGIAGGWYPGQKGCRIMCLRIGFTHFSMDNAAASFQYATDMGATAINCSWKSWYSEYFKDTIDYALYNDVLIVAAAGNENGIYCDDPIYHYLNMVPGVLVVAATDQNDQRAIFYGGQASNYGPCIDVSAPGKDILSTCISSDYYRMSGTSMSAPMVTGLAGLLKSQSSDWSRMKIKDAIVLSADDIGLSDMGSGRINAYTALRQTFLPVAPSNLNATPTAYNQIDLSWQDNADNELEFKIERKTDTSEFLEIGTVEKNITSYKDKTCSMGTTYYYRVRAHNLAGNSSFSNTASATIPTGPPAAPSHLIARSLKFNFEILLRWRDNSNNESGFMIERKSNYYPWWQEWSGTCPNETTCYDGDIGCDEIYYYRMRAYNPYGYSSYTNTAYGSIPCF